MSVSGLTPSPLQAYVEALIALKVRTINWSSVLADHCQLADSQLHKVFHNQSNLICNIKVLSLYNTFLVLRRKSRTNLNPIKKNSGVKELKEILH